MKTKLLCAFTAAALSASPAAAQLRITSQTAQVNVAAANDWATRAFQDPIDMSQRTDVGWWLFGTDAPASNWVNPTFTNGLFTGTTASDSRLFLLESGLFEPADGSEPSVPVGKTGKNYPIDAGTYTHLVYRMSSSTGFFGSSVTDDFPRYIWSTKTIYDGQTVGFEQNGSSTAVMSGFAIYDINLPSLDRLVLSGTNTPWSGTIRALQLIPNIHQGSDIQLDWVRLVQDDDTLKHNITWTGASGNVDLYLDNDRDPSNGSLGRIAINRSGTSFTFFTGALPAGDYYVAVTPTANGQTTPALASYSTGFFRVNDIPTLTFTTPSDEGSSDDFATTRLGNPWDFTSLADIDSIPGFAGKSNITNDSITQIPLTTESGVPLGNQTVYFGTSAPATPASGNVGDPFLFTLFWDGKGKVTQIDPARYRILTVEMGIPNLARSLPGGSIGRIVWRARNEPNLGSDGLKGQTVGEHYVFNHKLGENVLSKTTIDMKDYPLEPGSVGKSTWLSTTSLGGLDALRFDPHEFSATTPFFTKRIKLAALERTVGNLLTFQWNTSKAGTVTLFRDTSTTRSFNAGTSTQIASISAPAGAGSHTWDATAVADAEYQIWARITDGTNINQVYAPTPVVVDHNNIATKQLVLNRTQLNFATFGPTRTQAQVIRLTFSGVGSECWTSSSDLAGLTISPASGNGATNISISATGNFPGGTTSGLITLQSCTNSSNRRAISVSVTAYNTTGAPSGSFDTPTDGATVFGSVGVSGWATDDIEVTGVTVCRDAVPGESAPPEPRCGGNAQIFIGNATFIDDARPDIESASATTPFNYRAGWGYLMLTNFLPNQGNSVVRLSAYASDRDGHVALLGAKTITTQNSLSIRPFGAIDTPEQGQVVCGPILNFGWALTQPGKDIPANSSTIGVFVDDTFVGRPGARAARPDITAFFPGHDTTHAVGGFPLDTTLYSNGVHRIFWVVTDSAGQQDGIGSRFFTISNPCGG